MNEPATKKLSGWVILDKPQGLTSTQALGRVRRLVGGKKAGHGGTLDPLATGVLPLAFGEATKLIPYVMDGEKEYEFEVTWGERRTTDDSEGEVMEVSPVRPREEQIFKVMQNFIGHIKQTPPVFSAIKIDGQRAYDMARAGKEPKMVSRTVRVYDLALLKVKDKDHAIFRVVCGKGTYVRALARDMGQFLGTCGYVSELRRIKVGPFDLERSISLEKLEELSHKGAAQEAMLEVGSALDDIPGLTLTSSEAQRLRAGMTILIKPHHLSLMEEPVIVARYEKKIVAIVKAEDGVFRVVRGFNL